MDAREIEILKRHPVSVYLDVGANRGQSGQMLRKAGFTGRIFSFEPLSECYADLAKLASNDALWTTFHTAIGAESGETRIGISENFVSSSILEQTEALTSVMDSVKYKGFETVTVRRLDEILPDLLGAKDSAHLKIDTQGFERFVIQGAEGILPHINSINAEVAVSEGYKGEMQVTEAVEMMKGLGFTLVDAWSAWRHPETGDALYFDFIFRKKDVTISGPSTSPFAGSGKKSFLQRLGLRA